MSIAAFHFFYDDDAAVYYAPCLAQAAEYLQNAFVVLQITLHKLKLVLNANKEVAHCGGHCKMRWRLSSLGILIDDSLHFKQ